MSLKITVDFSPTNDSLREAVCYLSPNIKQAFYHVAKRGTLNRGTWNNCVFNAASAGSVRNTESAMAKFGASQFVVCRFISAWDRTMYKDNSEYFPHHNQATEYLIKLLEAVGLASPPAQAKVETYEDAEGLDEFLIEASVDEMIRAIEELSVA